jgi:uncharacterized protein YkwD
MFTPAPKLVQIYLKTPAISLKVMPTSAQYAPIADLKPIAIPLAQMTPKAEATPMLKSSSGATPTPKSSPSATPTRIYLFHLVTAADTLISIAAKYNVTTEALLAANEIRDPNSLEEGQPLLIPPKDRPVNEKIVLHQVKNGESALDIATKYGSSVKDIQSANPHLSLDSVREGETVAVPVIFAKVNSVSAPDGVATPIYHVVQSGEMPLSIASQYNVPVEILLTANDITDPTKLQIGQVLMIPPHDGITLGFPVVLYELTETDTLVGIASRFGSSVKDILAVNPDLDPSNLQAGQLVAIPVIFAPPRPTPDPSAPSRPRPTPGPPPPGLQELEQQMIAAVNAQREANGLPPYLPDAELAQAALAHSQDMVVRDYLSHVTPDGEGLRDRLADFGIGALAQVGENIQKNTQPASKTVETAINWFMNSRPHRANILHPRHNRIGVGIVEGPPGWFPFTLVFAER